MESGQHSILTQMLCSFYQSSHLVFHRRVQRICAARESSTECRVSFYCCCECRWHRPRSYILFLVLRRLRGVAHRRGGQGVQRAVRQAHVHAQGTGTEFLFSNFVAWLMASICTQPAHIYFNQLFNSLITGRESRRDPAVPDLPPGLQRFPRHAARAGRPRRPH